MKKQKTGSIFCVCCIGAVLLLPSILLLIMSVKDYSPLRGLFGSPFVGLENIDEILSNTNIWRLLGNTLAIHFISLLTGMLYLFAAFLAIGSFSNRIGKVALTILFALPALIPINAYTIMLLEFLPTETLITSSILLQIIAGAESGLRFSAVFVIGALFAGENPPKAALQYCLLFLGMRLLRILTLDSAFLQDFSNPLTYEHLDTFDRFFYRKGLMESNFSLYAGGYVIQCLLQLLPAIAGVLILAKMFRNQETTDSHPGVISTPSESSGRFLPMAAFAFLPALLLALCLASRAEGTLGLGIPAVRAAYVNGTFLSAITAVVVMGLGFLLGKSLAILGTAGACVGAILYFSLDNLLGPYLFNHSLGLINTFAGTVLQSFYYIAPIGLVSAFILRQKNRRSQTRPLALAGFGLAFAWFWGNHMPALLILNQPHAYPISLVMHQSILAQNASASALIYTPESGPLSTVLYIAIPVLVAGACIAAGGLKFTKISQL